MRRDVFVYLSGPITAKDGITVEENVLTALVVYLDCVRLGIPAFCPHLCAIFPSAWAIDWATWLAMDLAVIDRCTHVWTLPRWETSAGALKEVAYARDRGIPVVSSLIELMDVVHGTRDEYRVS